MCGTRNTTTTNTTTRKKTPMHLGYANYPTATVAMWIDNNKSMSHMVRLIAQQDAFKGNESPDVRFAEWLEKMVEASLTMTGVRDVTEASESVADTFLSHVMTQVDWLELARKYMRDES